MKFDTHIDDDKTHHQILFELGILDDEEDWPLFQKMQTKEFELMNTIPEEVWNK